MKQILPTLEGMGDAIMASQKETNFGEDMGYDLQWIV